MEKENNDHLLLEERNETLKLIHSCDNPFLLNGINDILRDIIGNEERIRKIGNICYDLYGKKDFEKYLEQNPFDNLEPKF